MKARQLLAAFGLGAVLGMPLLAFFFAGAELASLPYLPYDLFDSLARILPGGLVTLGIDTIVAAVRALNVGPTAAVAKTVEQLLALSLTIALAGVVGAAVYWLTRAPSRRPETMGVGAGLVFAALALVARVALGKPVDLPLALLWFFLPLSVWGAALGAAIDGAFPAGGLEEGAAGGGISRRALLLRLGGGVVAFTAVLWGLGSALRRSAPAVGSGTPTPVPVENVPPPPAGRLAAAPGTRPEVTPNADFYRVDIDLLPINIPENEWILEVRGAFARPRNLTLSDLKAFPAVTEPRTLSCISNPVGGDLIGNAYWTGLRLRDLLADLGISAAAQELYIRAEDGFYETLTLADLNDPRTLLIYGMNGAPLPADHGFPLRILIPDRYGMKQPKWITSIEAREVVENRGYWPERGWSEDALVQIMSQIDTVALDQAMDGRVPVGGIAYTGAQGVSKVEVQVENGPWQETQLITPPLGPLTWVQWRYDWPRGTASGPLVFRVRATDSRDNLQIERRAGPRPDGATGYHAISRSV